MTLDSPPTTPPSGGMAARWLRGERGAAPVCFPRLAAAWLVVVAATAACAGKSNSVYTRMDAGSDAVIEALGPDVTEPMIDAPMGEDAPLDVPMTDTSGTPDLPVASPCANNVMDGTETDVDCGGLCGKCANGKVCATAADCAGDVCTAGLCQAVGCVNLAKDSAETDIDCGGPTCAPCGQGKQCTLVRDCQSGTCTGGICETNSCTDRVKNGTETDIDCGGATCPACGPAASCAVARDCDSGLCAAARCAVPSCADGIKDGDETGKDCGGGCPGCPTGEACTVASDCVSTVCMSALCAAGTCSDVAKNGTETDIDCGGTTCAARCPTGKGCLASTDCAAGACTGGLCQSASCADGLKDGTETDKDCGGAACGPCSDALACTKASDCASGVCKSNVCAAPSCTDTIKNGSESDVNCGGSCPACGPTSKCNGPGDCSSLVCLAGACRSPTCTDKVKNGTEIDVDCGSGSGCPKCGAGKTCKTGVDCDSASCQGGQCQGPSCTDGVKNGTETDLDCGGASCPGCDDGKVCKVGTDCVNAVCPAASLKCAMPLCTDGAKNGSESDVDCGGPCAYPGMRCADGKGCGTGGDCLSFVCGAGMKCAAPTCSDLAKNSTETDVDCGGACTTKCAIGKACGTSDANCAAGAVCKGGVCVAPTCSDTTKDGMETDLDCGGPDCAKCADGKGCAGAGDCTSGVCTGTTAKTCAVPSCTDSARNGAETDLNCGGGTCPTCADGKMCMKGGDCASGVCAGGLCAAPACDDTVKNGTETDLNCGGPKCAKCANGKVCAAAGDCVSGVCTGTTTKTCAVPSCTDGVRNSNETDVDCGGSCTPMFGCNAGQMCAVPTDCKSSSCTAATMTCAIGGCQTCWKVQYQYTVASQDNNWSGQNFNIVKTGTSTTPLSDLKIRYWFAARHSGPLSAQCFYFPGGNGNVTFSFAAVSPARTGADTYLEVGFKTGTSWGMGSSGVIQTGFHFDDFTVFSQPFGYSSDTTATTLRDSAKVTLYDAAGNLVWGTEP